MDKLSAIILAGGVGKRMGKDIPKQFLLLGNRPILMQTISQFVRAFDDIPLDIILVMNPDYMEYWQKLIAQYQFSIPHKIIPGGKERFYSVKNGLQAASDQGLIAIHDGVRPLITIEFLQNLYQQAKKYGNAVPYTLPKSSVRIVQNGYNKAIDRNTIRLIQTPQIFYSKEIKKAYNQEYKSIFTDDATVFEHLGHNIHLVEGIEENIKITTEIDLFLAEKILEKRKIFFG